MMLHSRIESHYSININNQIDSSIGCGYSESPFTHRSPAMNINAFWADCLEHLAAIALAN